MKLAIQGDTVYVPSELPKEVIHDKSNIIIKSPVTGHAHRILGEAHLYRTKEGKVFVSSSEPFAAVHEEHFDLVLPAGNYEIRTPLERDHLQELTRAVID